LLGERRPLPTNSVLPTGVTADTNLYYPGSSTVDSTGVSVLRAPSLNRVSVSQGRCHHVPKYD